MRSTCLAQQTTTDHATLHHITPEAIDSDCAPHHARQSSERSVLLPVRQLLVDLIRQDYHLPKSVQIRVILLQSIPEVVRGSEEAQTSAIDNNSREI